MNRIGFWRGKYLVCVRRREEGFLFDFLLSCPKSPLTMKGVTERKANDLKREGGEQVVFREHVSSAMIWQNNCPPAKYVFMSSYLICFLFGAMEASSFGSLCTCQARCCLDFCSPRSYRLHCCMTAWSLDQVLTIWNPPIFEASQASPSCSYWILNNNASVLDLGRLISWSKCWW